ncbi:MAG TPA: DUF819 family protein [Clostridia bacterium]|jgi:uncharacterized membrane protein|nr:DUF819 family protein [Clostridiaceae bacterium]HOF26274.1 DUF819 family protein [Clostridia bacterium]HOM35052.1 DUF819 family protein [Clostridia bacterium]HOR89550.1 DUF819 family protein [Clostridia bacterium]HOT70044.1 DUF819 family protein [Clostridia bacterium]
MLAKIIQLVLFFGIPYILYKLENKVKLIKTVGPIIFCYAIGIIWANSGLPLDAGLSDIVSSVLIPIAITLILFNSDFTTLRKNAKKAGLSFLILSVSVMVVAAVSVLVFPNVYEKEKIASMLVGCYTGGTPNLFAIGYGVNADKNTIIVANLADQVLGGVYFLFICTLAKPLLNKLSRQISVATEKTEYKKEGIVDKVEIPVKEKIKQGVIAILLGIAALGVSIGISYLLTKEATNVAIIMLGVSVIGVALSFVKGVRQNKVSYSIGQYFIYVFSLAVGSMADLKLILGQSVYVLGMVAFVLFVTMFLHFFIALLFKIDADTIIITSIAGIFGPAFIIPTAKAIKNEGVILIGIATGLLGYAIGNFMGFGLYEILKLIY